MAVYHADALVIRSREYGESDRLVTLFARDQGKIQAVAKGVRKPTSRQRAGAQLFTYADFLLHHGRSLDTVSQASPKESFAHLWWDLDRSMAATAMAELLDAATIPGQSHPELFSLTLTCFFLLEEIEPQLLLSAYTLRLLAALGYRPRLGECAECGSRITGERLFFSWEAGGTTCSHCPKPAGKWVSAGSIAFMRQLLTRDLAKLGSLRWNLHMQKEVIEILRIYSEHRVERTLRSWSMGDKLRDVGQHDEDGKD